MQNRLEPSPPSCARGDIKAQVDAIFDTAQTQDRALVDVNNQREELREAGARLLMALEAKQLSPDAATAARALAVLIPNIRRYAA